MESEWSQVILVFFLGATVSWFTHRLKFPNAVVQVLLGVILGRAVLGWVDESPILQSLGQLGVVLLLGVAGLEFGIQRLYSAGWAGVAVALLGIILSFGGGYLVADLYGSPVPESVYLGLALSATSIGISVQVLQQYGLIGHRVANVVIAAAVIDDVIALYLLGAVHGVLSEGLRAEGIMKYIVLVIVVLSIVYASCRILTRWLRGRKVLDNAWVRAAWCLLAIFTAAVVTDALELSSVVGGFFAGMGVGEGLTPGSRERSVHQLKPLVMMTIPFFFVMIGLQAQWDVLEDASMVGFVVLLIIIAISAKVGGGILGSIREPHWIDRLLIATAMVSRGEIALVVVTIGYAQQHVTHHTFVAVVLMTIVLALLGPLLMAPLARYLENSVSEGRRL